MTHVPTIRNSQQQHWALPSAQAVCVWGAWGGRAGAYVHVCAHFTFLYVCVFLSQFAGLRVTSEVRVFIHKDLGCFLTNVPNSSEDIQGRHPDTKLQKKPAPYAGGDLQARLRTPHADSSLPSSGQLLLLGLERAQHTLRRQHLLGQRACPGLLFMHSVLQTLGKCGHQLHGVQSGEDHSAQGRHARAAPLTPVGTRVCKGPGDTRGTTARSCCLVAQAARLLPGLPGELRAQCRHAGQTRAPHGSPPDMKAVGAGPWGRKTRTTQEASAGSRGDSTSRL